MSKDPRSNTWLSFGLAFVGGYADAASFILAGTFTGHVTGNLVLLAISVARQDWPTCFRRSSAVALFLAGTLFSIVLERFVARRGSWPLLPIAMSIEIILICTAYFAMASHLAAGLLIFAGCMSTALGLQNGSFRQAGGTSVHTTYLTGTITGLLISHVQKLATPAASAPGGRATRDPRLSLLYGIWIAFVLGAGIGAATVFRFEALGILGAAFLLLVMVFCQAMAVARCA